MVHFNVVCLGNPGAGKSLILNSMSQGRYVSGDGFVSGTSFLTGLTRKKKEIKGDGYTYIDTPGLNDTLGKEEIKTEIESAFSSSGVYKIIFVMSPNRGRIAPTDIETMNTILQAVEDKVGDLTNHFSLIINSVNDDFITQMNTESGFEMLHATLFQKYSTQSIMAIKQYDEVGQIFKSSVQRELKEFRDSAPSLEINNPITLSSKVEAVKELSAYALNKWKKENEAEIRLFKFIMTNVLKHLD